MISLRTDARHLAAPVARGGDEAWRGISGGAGAAPDGPAPAAAFLLPPVSLDARTNQLVAGEHPC